MSLLSKAFSEIFTFTRASTGARINASGFMETVAENLPRFDYDPVTLLPKGILIEEQRTNLLRQSNDLSQSVWAKTDSTITSTTNAFGMKLVQEGSAGTAQVRQDVTGVVANSRCFSTILLQKGNCDWVQIIQNDGGGGEAKNAWFNLDTGAWGTVSSAPGAAHANTLVSLGGGIYALSIAFIPNSTVTSRGFIIRSASANGSSVRVPGANYFAGYAQMEVGAFPTSYIPTAGSQVTRAADVLKINTLSPWYNQSEGALFAEYAVSNGYNAGSSNAAVSMGDGTTSSFISLRTIAGTTYPNFAVRVAGVTDVSLDVSSATSSGRVKLAGAYKLNDFAMSAKGLAVVYDTSGSIPNVSVMTIGYTSSPGTNVLNGHIGKLKYFPKRLTDAQLQALTA